MHLQVVYSIECWSVLLQHYEAQVVKLQSRVLELEEQLALANASTIRKDRTIQETKHKFQCAIKKLEEMSNCSAKEVHSLREEKEYLEKELKKEKEVINPVVSIEYFLFGRYLNIVLLL